MARPSCKDIVIDAAEAVVLEGGAGNLTLDAVAQRAGVSKGGLLYHFPSKQALLEGMVARLLERSTHRRAATIEGLPEGPARQLKGEILALLNSHDETDRVKAALLAAVANEPRLMKTIREHHLKRFGAISKDRRLAREALLRLSADGLFLMELLQVSPFTAKQRETLVEELLRQAEVVTAVDTA